MRSLYDISQDLQKLDALLDEHGGDVTDPEVEAAVDQWFDQLGEERDEKLDNYAALIQEFEARAQARKDEAKRLADRARRDQDQAGYLKKRLIEFFDTHGLQKVDTRRYTIARRRSGGRLPVILHVETDQLPEEFVRIRRDADKDAIREALEAGADLDFAELGERSEYLNIR